MAPIDTFIEVYKRSSSNMPVRRKLSKKRKRNLITYIRDSQQKNALIGESHALDQVQ